MTHQEIVAKALQKGLRRHGLSAEIVGKDGEAEMHVCIGPWFALSRWRYSRTLYIDRAYWGDPECVSVHWLEGGEKLRLRGMPYRPHPELHPMKSGHKSIYLCDYGETPDRACDSVRPHPAQQASGEPLSDVLDRHDVAIGKRTTALVEAHMRGLRVITDDPHSPVYDIRDREQWARDLAWHNWSINDIEAGEAWEALK